MSILSTLSSVTNELTLLLQDFSMECAICYAYRFNDEVPDQMCDNPHCIQMFHTSCLVEVCSLQLSHSLALSEKLDFFIIMKRTV